MLSSGLDRLILELAPYLTHSDLVATAVDAVHKQGWYYQCTFEPHRLAESHGCKAMSEVRALRPGSKICKEAYAITDPMHSSLLLFGKAGLCTGFHVDRTQAENIAFPLSDKAKVRRTV